MSNRVSIRGLSLALLVGFSLAVGVGFGFFLYKLPRAEPKRFEAQAAALVVFTGAPQRIPKALQLLSKNHAPVLFVSGVHHNALLEDITRQVQRRFPTERVILERSAKNTFQNAIETKNWTQKNAIDTIILVTSRDHMPRSRLYLRALAPELLVIPYAVRSSSRVHLLREYAKFLASFLHLGGLCLQSAIVSKG